MLTNEQCNALHCSLSLTQESINRQAVLVYYAPFSLQLMTGCLLVNHMCGQALLPARCLLRCIAARYVCLHIAKVSVDFFSQEKGQLLENVFADPKGFGVSPGGGYRYEQPGFGSGTAAVS